MEQQRQEWTRSPLTLPGGDKRCSAGREHRCQRAHALCLHIHRVRLLACRSSTALVVKTPCFLPPTSDTVQNRLQKHAGQRGSPRPRRRAPHGAQPDLLPFVSYYFIIRSRNGWQSVRTTTGGKNLLTRQRKRSVKALFFFFFFSLTSDAEQICECRVRFGAVWRLPSLEDFTHYWQRLLHGSTELNDLVRTNRFDMEAAVRDGVNPQYNSSLRSCLHWPRSITASESSSCNLRPILIVDYVNPFVTTATASIWGRKHGII